MADISTLTGSIITEAETQAQNIINLSKEKAQKIVEQKEYELAKLLNKIENEAASKTDMENKSFESEKRKISENAMSDARMNFYYQVIDAAKSTLKNTSPEIQLSYITKKLEMLKIPENSKISLSAKISDSDTDRICKKYNLKKGEKINDFGFLITTHSYTENYTLESIFEENRTDFIKFLHSQPEVK